jgi:hypothetical protein
VAGVREALGVVLAGSLSQLFLGEAALVYIPEAYILFQSHMGVVVAGDCKSSSKLVFSPLGQERQEP